MSLTSDIIRGHTETIILAQLLDGDSYGYNISKAIKSKSEGAYEPKEATLYTAFRRLEQNGLIRSYWGDEDTGARRRYYSVTEEGRRLFDENKNEWIRVRSIIDKLIEK